MNNATERYTLRILSGPMYGVDLTLPAAEWLYIWFADADKLAQQSETGTFTDASFHAENSIFVPAPHNMEERFILRFSSPQQQQDSLIADEVAADNGMIERDSGDFITAQRLSAAVAADDKHALKETIAIALNQPISIGCMTLAVKNIVDSWSDSVVNYQPESGSSPPQPKAQPARIVTVRRQWLIPCLAGLAILALAVALGIYFISHHDRTASLQEVLREVSPAIVKTSDNRYYVVVDSLQKKSWVYNALRKKQLLNDNVAIVDADHVVEEIKSVLRQKGIPFFDVQLSDRAELTLVISSERWPATKNNDQTLNDILQREISWLPRITLKRVSDKELTSVAEGNIKSSGLISQRDSANNYVNYIVRGDIDDNHLLAFQRQVNEFYHQYGDEYVKFIIVLNEDPLRDKSLKVGRDGYILIPGNHWLYSDITASNN